MRIRPALLITLVAVAGNSTAATACQPDVLRTQHRPEPADRSGQAELEKKLAVAEAAVGSDHADLVPILIELGLVKADVALLERALTIREKSLGPESAGVADVLLLLAQVRRFDAASEPILLRAVRILERDTAANAQALGRALAFLQGFYLIHKRTDDARALTERIQALSAPRRSTH